MNKAFFSSRKFRQGAFSTVITLFVIALLVLVNFLASTLTGRFNIKADLTENKMFSITDSTRDFLQGLEQDVTIFVLTDEDDFPNQGQYYYQANEVLRRYSDASPRVQLQYIDLLRNPGFQQQYPEIQLTDNTILVQSGDKIRDLTVGQLYNSTYNYYTGSSTVTGSRAEQELTSAILYVTGDELTTVTVISGHNESDTSTFQAILERNNFVVRTQTLVTEEVDPTTDILLICAPQRDFSEEELNKLDRFLENGGQYGKTLVFFAPNVQADLPNLTEFLAEWGVGLGSGMVFETDSSLYYPQDPYMAVLLYAEGEYTANLQAQDMYCIGAYSRPLSLLWEANGLTTAQVLLTFSETSGIIPADADENWRATEETLEGPIPHLILSTHQVHVDLEPRRSHVLSAGSPLFINSSIMADPSMGNSQLILELLDTLSGKERGVLIEDKAVDGQALNINAMQAVILGLLFAIIIPLALLIFGIVIWMRRRHR